MDLIWGTGHREGDRGRHRAPGRTCRAQAPGPRRCATDRPWRTGCAGQPPPAPTTGCNGAASAQLTIRQPVVTTRQADPGTRGKTATAGAARCVQQTWTQIGDRGGGRWSRCHVSRLLTATASGTRCDQPCGPSGYFRACGPAPGPELRFPRGWGCTGQGMCVLHQPPHLGEHTRASPSGTPPLCSVDDWDDSVSRRRGSKARRPVHQRPRTRRFTEEG